jgi:hypothetical protein
MLALVVALLIACVMRETFPVRRFDSNAMA